MTCFTSDFCDQPRHPFMSVQADVFFFSIFAFMVFYRNIEMINEPQREKTCFHGFRPGPTQTGLYSHRRRLEALNFTFRKQRNCTIYVVKTKALISCTVTAQLICIFVFAYAKSKFSHDTAQIIFVTW